GAAGLSFDVRLPEFLPLPFLAGVGPEGGGILLSVWFIALLAWAPHIVWRGAAKGKSQRRAIACWCLFRVLRGSVRLLAHPYALSQFGEDQLLPGLPSP